MSHKKRDFTEEDLNRLFAEDLSFEDLESSIENVQVMIAEEAIPYIEKLLRRDDLPLKTRTLAEEVLEEITPPSSP